MIKLTVCLKRKNGLSRAEFVKHWREVHAQLLLSVREFTRHVRRYSQCEIAMVPGLPPNEYDGVVELSFDSVEAMSAALAEPRYHEIIRPDEEKFVDHASTMLLVTTEFVLLP